MDRRPGLEQARRRDPHAPGARDAPEVVADQVHDHGQLGGVLGAREQLARDLGVAAGIGVPRARALDRPGLDAAGGVEAEEALGRGREEAPIAQVEVRHVGRSGVARKRSREQVGVDALQLVAAAEVDLEQVAGADPLLRRADRVPVGARVEAGLAGEDRLGGGRSARFCVGEGRVCAGGERLERFVAAQTGALAEELGLAADVVEAEHPAIDREVQVGGRVVAGGARCDPLVATSEVVGEGQEPAACEGLLAGGWLTPGAGPREEFGGGFEGILGSGGPLGRSAQEAEALARGSRSDGDGARGQKRVAAQGSEPAGRAGEPLLPRSARAVEQAHAGDSCSAQGRGRARGRASVEVLAQRLPSVEAQGRHAAILPLRPAGPEPRREVRDELARSGWGVSLLSGRLRVARCPGGT